MKDFDEMKHDIKNHLQVILFGLQAEAIDRHRVAGLKAVQDILDVLEGENEQDCA